MASYGFHPEALREFADAAEYYVREASAGVAEAFINAVEAGIRDVVAAPTRWRIVEEPSIRRYLCRPFP